MTKTHQQRAARLSVPIRVFSCSLSVSLVLFSVSLALGQEAGEKRLSELLKKYPQADTNRDGVLSLDEMRQYQASRTQRQRRSKIQAPPPTLENVRYGKWKRNVLDLWLPQTESPAPLLVYIHGGGFIGGNKEKIRESKNVQMALDRGVAFASIQYRFRHDENADSIVDGERTSIQNILRDSARAIQFLRWKAQEYNLDAKRVACYGGSAGAGTSIWLAFHDDLADPKSEDPVLRESTRISAAGMLAGQFSYDLQKWDEAFSDLGGDIQKTHGNGDRAKFERFFGLTEEEYNGPVGYFWRADVDMLAHISPDDPPVFILTNGPNQAPVTRGIYNHHPRHAELVEQCCNEHGCDVLCLLPKVRAEDALVLRRDPDVMMNFFFEKLGVAR